MRHCNCLLDAHCVSTRPGCRLRAGATINQGGGICGPYAAASGADTAPTDEAAEAAACRISTWTNQWRDPENGPFDGDERDYLHGLASAVLTAANAIDHPKVRADQTRRIVEWLRARDGHQRRGPALSAWGRIANQVEAEFAPAPTSNETEDV